MSLLIVGSIAYDSIETARDKAENILGGSATYSSVSASFFTNVKMVGVVGKDFRDEDMTFLKSRNIDVGGIEFTDGETFRWAGKYGTNVNEAETLDTRLGVFEKFEPKIPASFKSSEYVLSANIDPVLQSKIFNEMKNAEFKAVDTMNFWIQIKKDDLKKVFGEADILFINEGEAKMFTGSRNVTAAARILLVYGFRAVIIKRGEYGSLLYTKDTQFFIPSFLFDSVKDTTGAGDSFAGGFMGYLSAKKDTGLETLKQAMVYGTVMASFAIQEFSINAFKGLTKKIIEDRKTELLKLFEIKDSAFSL